MPLTTTKSRNFYPGSVVQKMPSNFSQESLSKGAATTSIGTHLQSGESTLNHRMGQKQKQLFPPSHRVISSSKNFSTSAKSSK